MCPDHPEVSTIKGVLSYKASSVFKPRSFFFSDYIFLRH